SVFTKFRWLQRLVMAHLRRSDDIGAQTLRLRQRRRRRCGYFSITRSDSGRLQHTRISPWSIWRWRMPPACFMSTWPETSRTRQVPQRPSRHENGSGKPAPSAAIRMHWSARHGTVRPDWLKLTEKTRASMPPAASDRAAGAVGAAVAAVAATASRWERATGAP